MSTPAPQLLLTPARWATWVAQRHEWNGYLWVRWPDAEAILLFVGGRPRIHLWDGRGWEGGDHALSAVAQRLERMPSPRWGQVALPAQWAAAIRELALQHPGLPTEVVSPEAWLAWASRTGFGGMAVLVGDLSGAWIVQEGVVRPVRFAQGAVVNGESIAPQAEGLLQIFRGRVSQELLPPAPLLPPEEVRVEAPEAPPEPPAPPAPPTISPPAPAESGETAVDQARSEASRRFRGDERFLLAPTVDMAGDVVTALAAAHGHEIRGWLPLLDGGKTLAEVAQAAAVPLGHVEAVVGALVDRRMVFRYTSRGRAPASSA